MLKKIIIGVLCFVILVVIGLGIYIYTLDWNKHKALVEQRFSQITGLRAVIDGDLNVELFPTPKFTANQIKFSKSVGPAEPLVQINSVSANVNLTALLRHKLILNSMNLTGATVNIIKNEKGEFNWSGVTSGNQGASDNFEVSFNDIHYAASNLNYKDLQNEKAFEISNISGLINAPSLKGPYKVNGNFMHNESEIKFSGNIIRGNGTTIKFDVENAVTQSKLSIDGGIGANAQGSLIVDTQNFANLVNVVLGDKALEEHYNYPLYMSFKYNFTPEKIILENFNVSYGENTKGAGVANIQWENEHRDISITLDMLNFDLNILENISKDIVAYSKSGKKFSDTSLAKYSGNVLMKSGQVTYKNATAQNLSLAIGLQDSIIALSRFYLELPGNTSIKTSGTVNLADEITYSLDNIFKTEDLRVFASIFDLDLSKLASADDKKAIFKKTDASFTLSGNVDNIKISIPQAMIDATEIQGNLGFIKNEEQYFTVADIKTSKILFDKYIQLLSEDVVHGSFENKLVHQFNLIPWNHDINVDARVLIASAVYNGVPLEKVLLEFQTNKENLQIKELSIENIAGANLNMKAEAQNIYTTPYFKELSYNIKTNNLPMFVSTLGIPVSSYKLFQRKLFASHGAMSGTLSNFSLSSVQKFGDTEFSYTGTVDRTKDKPLIDGSLELKTNNFTNFLSAINLDYVPDLPVTTFTLSGKITGMDTDFKITDLNSYLGANHIGGEIKFTNNAQTPFVLANLNFDKFDADRYFNLNKKELFTSASDETAKFITKPNLNSEKIDYSSLKKVNYDIKVASKQLLYKRKTYTDAKINTLLQDGVLKVSDFTAFDNDVKIKLDFTLNSNNLPEINGTYSVASISTPALGGNTYMIGSGLLTAEGDFKSSANSIKEFFDNLTSQGKFDFNNTFIKGWDLDLIKFEFEQRKSVDGLEDSVLNDLKSGQSDFSKISGPYNISNGLFVADNIVWEAPVANLNMKIDFNLSTWLFTAVFNGLYHNASFSDVLSYTFDGNLANPSVKVDLAETIQRISQNEKASQEEQKLELKEQQDKSIDKTVKLKKQIEKELQTISRIKQDIDKFKPETNNSDVMDIYHSNITILEDSEKTLSQMLVKLGSQLGQKDFVEIETELNLLQSKLKFIPKSLEDNYINDSRCVFDELFNKITWVYNVAHNNSSYYNGLITIYEEQFTILDKTETPVAEDKKEQLNADKLSILDDMEKIKSLYNKLRENYLSIVDSNKISEMRENIVLANQALRTLLSYTDRMDNKIINNLDDFRAVLDIQARDYDTFMIYPPLDPDKIDITKPTTYIEQQSDKKNASIKKNLSENTSTSDDNKKKSEPVSLETHSNVSKRVSDRNPREDLSQVSNLLFTGISSFIPATPVNTINSTSPQQQQQVIAIATPKTETPLTIETSKTEVALTIENPKTEVVLPVIDTERQNLNIKTKQILRNFLKEINDAHIVVADKTSMNTPSSATVLPISNSLNLFNSDTSSLDVSIDENQSFAKKSGFKNKPFNDSVAENSENLLPLNASPFKDDTFQSIYMTEPSVSKGKINGIIGKTMFLHAHNNFHPSFESKIIPNNYIFSTNTQKSKSFSGELYRRHSLNVK